MSKTRNFLRGILMKIMWPWKDRERASGERPISFFSPTGERLTSFGLPIGAYHSNDRIQYQIDECCEFSVDLSWTWDDLYHLHNEFTRLRDGWKAHNNLSRIRYDTILGILKARMGEVA